MPTAEVTSLNTLYGKTILSRLARHDNHEAWQLLIDRYGPLIKSYLRRYHLTPDDASDVSQDTLLALANAARERRIDPERGRLRSYLFTIVHNKVCDLFRQRRRNPAAFGRAGAELDPIELVIDESTAREHWEQEWSTSVSSQCLWEARQQFKPETYLVFHMRVVDGRSAREVAEMTESTENAVNLKVARVRRFLREIRPAIEERF